MPGEGILERGSLAGDTWSICQDIKDPPRVTTHTVLSAGQGALGCLLGWAGELPEALSQPAILK